LGNIEPVLWLAPLILGILAGLLPAWQAYRVNVIEKLFPS
jgi:ABC-type lipoprotein release transport system permease subunit